jgi:hypothetical protein
MTYANLSEPLSSPPDILPSPRKLGGPIGMLVNLFSSIWLGVTLLTLLFIYSSIGSAGAPVGEGMLRPWFILNPDAWIAVRQLPLFEMTEFEWFHWWPFDLLIALICINLVVATIRRIPFNVINLGVWMIHAGIIILAIGSVWYFSTKVEGDVPVSRRRVFVQAPGMPEPKSMVASPGASMVVGEGENGYFLQIREIDPNWELLTGDDKGQRAYKVSVMVQSKGGMFIRDLVAGKPAYTQDLIRSQDPQQPFVRAIKSLGKPLVDEAIQISLDYDAQEYFYLMDSHALYLREVGQTQWVQRPIRNLPRYSDYIASPGDVWPNADDDEESFRSRPIHVEIPASDENDPFRGETLAISRYLRYATMEARRKKSDSGPISPMVSFRLNPLKGPSQTHQLLALDQNQNTVLQGNVRFVWASSAQQLERFKTRVEPTITFTIPASSAKVEKKITSLTRVDGEIPFEPIDGTDYSFRVESMSDNMNINGRAVSLAVVQIKSPQKTFTRWVFDDQKLNRDLGADGSPPMGAAGHGGETVLDPSIETTYRPAEARPPIMLVAGPGENDLAVVVTKLVGQPIYTPAREGDNVPVTDGVSLNVLKYAARTIEEVRPFVVPREQRDRDAREHFSMVQLDLPASLGGESVWLPYHNFVFDDFEDVIRRNRHQPRTIALADGRKVEVLFGRERMKLPAPVVLEQFEVDSHIGGFTGASSSIADWRSSIRFKGEDGLSQPMSVSVNKPAEYNGFWFFQAMWDPPDPQPRFEGDPGSRGLNYTVLGVGNRNGVYVQLLGCCIAVIGMIYAFYCKPIIKRRRQQHVYASLRGEHAAAHSVVKSREPEPVAGAAWKVQT